MAMTNFLIQSRELAFAALYEEALVVSFFL